MTTVLILMDSMIFTSSLFTASFSCVVFWFLFWLDKFLCQVFSFFRRGLQCYDLSRSTVLKKTHLLLWQSCLFSLGSCLALLQYFLALRMMLVLGHCISIHHFLGGYYSHVFAAALVVTVICLFYSTRPGSWILHFLSLKFWGMIYNVWVDVMCTDNSFLLLNTL